MVCLLNERKCALHGDYGTNSENPSYSRLLLCIRNIVRRSIRVNSLSLDGS